MFDYCILYFLVAVFFHGRVTSLSLSWAGDAAWGSPAARSFACTVGEACDGRTRPENCNEKMTSLGLPWAGDGSGITMGG